jgi:hypothetical protein
MRTSISLDDRLAMRVRRRAREEGMSVSAWIARVLDDRLKRRDEPPSPPPFRLVTVGGGGPRAGIDLDRPRELLVAEDEARYGDRRRD